MLRLSNVAMGLKKFQKKAKAELEKTIEHGLKATEKLAVTAVSSVSEKL